MPKPTHYRYIFVACFIMAILFYSSSQPYTEQSLVSFIDVLLPSQPFKDALSHLRFDYAGQEISVASYGYGKFIEFFLRKAAHFTSYFLLASAWFLAFRDRTRPQFAAISFIAWGLATTYAALDEIHQHFTEGRTALYQDVVLDSVGALTGVIFCLLWHRYRYLK